MGHAVREGPREGRQAEAELAAWPDRQGHLEYFASSARLLRVAAEPRQECRQLSRCCWLAQPCATGWLVRFDTEGRGLLPRVQCRALPRGTRSPPCLVFKPGCSVVFLCYVRSFLMLCSHQLLMFFLIMLSIFYYSLLYSLRFQSYVYLILQIF